MLARRKLTRVKGGSDCETWLFECLLIHDDCLNMGVYGRYHISRRRLIGGWTQIGVFAGTRGVGLRKTRP